MTPAASTSPCGHVGLPGPFFMQRGLWRPGTRARPPPPRPHAAPPAALPCAHGRVRSCRHAAAPAVHPTRSPEDLPHKPTSMGCLGDGGIGTGLMGDGSRKRPSRKSTPVVPVVYAETRNVSVLEEAVGWGERVVLREALHVSSPFPPAAHFSGSCWIERRCWRASMGSPEPRCVFGRGGPPLGVGVP